MRIAYLRTVKLCILGDLHFARLRIGPRHLMSKRVLGQANLLLKRRKQFNHALIDATVGRVAAVKPDALVLPGDFTTTAMPMEFEAANQALQPIAAGRPVYAVPGNHDRYTFRAAKDRRAEALLPGWMPSHYPALEQLNRTWRVLRIDTAVPRRIKSSGRVGDEQLAAVEQRLQSVPAGQGVLVVTHYPTVLPPQRELEANRALDDAEALREALERSPGPVVAVHGHVHQPWRYGPSQGAPYLSINAGAPVMIGEAYPFGQGFWEIDLPDDPSERPRLTHHRMTAWSQSGPETAGVWTATRG